MQCEAREILATTTTAKHLIIQRQSPNKNNGFKSRQGLDFEISSMINSKNNGVQKIEKTNHKERISNMHKRVKHSANSTLAFPKQSGV